METLETKRYGTVDILERVALLVKIRKHSNDDAFWIPADKLKRETKKQPRTIASITGGCKTEDFVALAQQVGYKLYAECTDDDGVLQACVDAETAGVDIPHDCLVMVPTRSATFPKREWRFRMPHSDAVASFLPVVSNGDGLTPSAIRRGNNIEINFASVCIELMTAGLKPRRN